MQDNETQAVIASQRLGKGQAGRRKPRYAQSTSVDPHQAPGRRPQDAIWRCSI